MKKTSFKIAYGGITVALCLVAMFCTGIIPFSVYIMPVIASVLLLFIKEELGLKWAVLSFIAVGVLSLILTPDWEAKLIFITTIGWYPLARQSFEKIKPKALSFIIRIACLNITSVLCYGVLIYVFGMNELLDTGGIGQKVFFITIIISAELMFLCFDLLCGRLGYFYGAVISKKIRRIIK